MENNKRSWEAAVLVLVVFVLGVLLGGLGDHLWGTKVWGMQPRPITHRDQIIDTLTHELDLTPEQVKQVTAAVDQKQEEIDKLYAPLEAQRDQIRQQGREQIRAVLTPAQQVKFDAFLNRLDETKRKEKAEEQ
jgi:Spy/CpxP family protein refolding chaperone